MLNKAKYQPPEIIVLSGALNDVITGSPAQSNDLGDEVGITDGVWNRVG